jgi:hypothetical protein
MLVKPIAIYGLALQEKTRERVPLDWRGPRWIWALEALGERESGTAPGAGRGGQSHDRSSAAAVGAYMMRKYPDRVHAWIVAQGGLSDRLATMSYEYASRFIRTCS